MNGMRTSRTADLPVEQQLVRYADALVARQSSSAGRRNRTRTTSLVAAAAVVIAAIGAVGMLSTRSDDEVVVGSTDIATPVPERTGRRWSVADGVSIGDNGAFMVEQREPMAGVGGELFETLVVTSLDDPGAVMYIHVISGRTSPSARPDAPELAAGANSFKVNAVADDGEAVILSRPLADKREVQVVLNGGGPTEAADWVARLDLQIP